MWDVFVSYRTDDVHGVAVLLDEKLCERLGVDRVFRDSRAIGLGADFRTVLWGALGECQVAAVVIGPGWRRKAHDPDDFVRREIALALSRDIKVIPVLVGDVPKLEEHELPTDIGQLAYRQYRRVSVRGMHREIELLVDEIVALTGRDRPPATGGPARAGRRGTAALMRFAAPEDLDAGHKAVGAALADAGIGGTETVRLPFGLVVHLPENVPPVRAVSGFVTSLETALRQDGSLRAVVGVTSTDGDADPRDELGVLMAAPQVAEVRRRAARAGLVLVVPDGFYDGVVRAHPEVLDPSTYLATADGRAWVHVPGYSAPPGLRGRPAAGSTGTAAPPGAGAGVANHGPNYGWQFGGDYVNGNKTEYHYGPDHR